MPVQMLQLCQCWLCDANAMPVQMLCKCWLWDANAMPVQMLQLCKCWLWDANAMPVQMLQLCKCWLWDANIYVSTNVTAMQMLAIGCQYICQCKCYSYANVGYAMPIQMAVQMLQLCNRWLWSQVLRVANYHVKCCVVGMPVLNCASDGRVGWVRFPYQLCKLAILPVGNALSNLRFLGG